MDTLSVEEQKYNFFRDLDRIVFYGAVFLDSKEGCWVVFTAKAVDKRVYGLPQWAVVLKQLLGPIKYSFGM